MPRSPNKADTPKSTEKKPPEFPKLNANHIKFLRKRQPEYLAVREQIKSVSVGQRKVKNTKGQQQQWVVDNVLPAFRKEFHDANNYSAQSVKEVSLFFFKAIAADVLSRFPETVQVVC